MLPPIQLRCEEQLLSKHRVLGPVLPVNEQQLFEHELSMANAEFHLSAARQSRHALWFDFQSRALVASKGEDETEDGTSGPSMPCRGRQRSFTNWSFDSVRREHLRFEYTAKVLNLEEHKGMVKLGKSDVVVRPLGHEGAACSSPCSRDDSAKFRRWLIQLYRESEQPVMAT
ncbi:unnamed protein product [Durusdinium trenchii]|uniref:Uncharacterized protein n=1 Tax=Durusdinium trenchii TaxID=1381693 RepID=A0ABP0IWZ1_9DINO